MITRLLVKVDHVLDKTWLYNIKDDFLYFIRRCKRYNLKFTWNKSSKFTAQMFSIFNFKPKVVQQAEESLEAGNELLEGLQETKANADMVIGKVNAFTDTALEMINNLKGSLVPFNNGIWAGLVKLIIQLMSAAYLLSQECNQNAMNICAIVTTALTGIVPVNDLIDQLILAVKAAVGYQAQAGHSNNLITVLFNILSYLFNSIFSTVDAAASAAFKVQTEFLSNIIKASAGLTKIVDVFYTVCCKFVDYVADYLISYYGYVPSFLKGGVAEVEALVRDFTEYESKNYNTTAMHNIPDANFVVSLYSRLNKLEGDLLRATVAKKSSKNFALPYVVAMKKTC